MDKIYEAYTNINSKPYYDPWMDKNSRKIADLAMDFYNKRNPSQEETMSLWREVCDMFNLSPVFIDSKDVKKFMADFENVGMEMTDKGQNVNSKMIKKHMKKWIA